MRFGSLGQCLLAGAGHREVVPSDKFVVTELDEEQLRAVNAPRGPLAILAGAGCGKTRAITHRIAHLVSSEQVEAKNVLAVTHSSRAAGELRDRLGKLGVGQVDARTFHSAALLVLRSYWPKLGRAHALSVVDNRYSMVRAALEKVDRREPSNEDVFDLSSEIGWAKSSLIGPAKYAQMARKAGRQLPRDAGSIAKVFRAYEGIKDKSGRLDFEDILLLAADLIESDEEVADDLSRKHQCLVVDEYQDTDPAQQRFLDAVLRGRDDLCVVGDFRQSIYQFKGADPGILAGFKNRYPDATIVELVKDYRSTPEIVSLANALIPVGAPLALVGQQPSGDMPLIVNVADEASEEALVVRRIKDLLNSGVPGREIAILYRFNSQSARFEGSLSEAGVNYRVADNEKFFERPEIRGPLTTFGRLARQDPDQSGLSLLYAVLAETGFDVDSPPDGAGAARSRYDALVALTGMCEGFVDATTLNAGQMLHEINQRAAAAHIPTTDGVTLSTLHKAKGLEYDAVFLVGLTEGSIPSMYANTAEQLDEERRLLYVGITRARRHLQLSWSSTRPGAKGATWSSKPSQFLPVLQAAVKQSGVGGSSRRNSSSSPAVDSTSGGRWKSVSSCEKCGADLKGIAARGLGRCSPGCLDGQQAGLYGALVTWRKAARGDGDKRFCSDRALFSIVERQPLQPADLTHIAGIDKDGLGSWWAEIADVCALYSGGNSSKTPESG